MVCTCRLASANLASLRCRGTGFTFGATADRFNFEAKLSERAWREFFLPPFFGAAEANVSGFMCSHSLCYALVVCSLLA